MFDIFPRLNWTSLISGLTLPPNVIRQPRGPEEGKGFQRERKVSNSASPDKIEARNATFEDLETADSSYDRDCESAIANLTIAPVIVTHGLGDSCSSDDEDEALEKSR